MREVLNADGEIPTFISLGQSSLGLLRRRNGE
jgi:hypothetical protein